MAAEPFVVHRPHARSTANQQFLAGRRLKEDRQRGKRQQQVEAGLTHGNVTEEGMAAARLPKNGLKDLNYRWCAPFPQDQSETRTLQAGRWHTTDGLMLISQLHTCAVPNDCRQ